MSKADRTPSAATRYEREQQIRSAVELKVRHAVEPFIVPDVRPDDVPFRGVFHVLRDMVDEGLLAHGDQGYTRVAT